MNLTHPGRIRHSERSKPAVCRKAGTRSIPNGYRWPAAICLAMVTMTTYGGCSSTSQDLQAFLRADEHKVSASEYRITPPDVVMVSAPGVPEIDGDNQLVRVDGMISLRLLGEVRVVGMTPAEVSAKLEDMLQRYYHEPKVHVRVGGYNSKKYYVLGEVGSPGPQAYTGRDTLFEVLARCQPNQMAWKNQIKVIRPSADSTKKHVITVDADKLTQDGDLKMNFLLQEGDIVYVPPTPLAWLGMRIREVVWPFEEASRAYAIPQNFMQTTDYYRDHRDNDRSSGNNDNEFKNWRMLLNAVR